MLSTKKSVSKFLTYILTAISRTIETEENIMKDACEINN